LYTIEMVTIRLWLH